MLSAVICINLTSRVSTLQVQLRPLVPCTQAEQVEHSLAAERRRMRLVHSDIMKDLLTNKAFQQGQSLWHRPNTTIGTVMVYDASC